MLIRCIAALCLLSATSIYSADFYVSTTGTSGNTGSIASPWSLAHALSHPVTVQPGDTIWLRGGTYTGTFLSTINGTSGSPIKVRQFPGERAIIDGGNSSGQIILRVAGSYTWYWGFEVMSSDLNRISAQITSGPNDIARGECVTTSETHGNLPGLKFINLILHDCRQGLSAWDEATGLEAYGNVIYNNGWEAPDRTHGHGIYTQNQTGIKLFRDNLLFDQFSHGFHAFGSEEAFLIGFDLQGNVSFNNFERAVLLGGGSQLQNTTATNNYTYGGVTKIGAGEDAASTTLTNNYFASVAAMELNVSQSVGPLTMTGNTFVGRLDNFESTDYPSNTYFEWLTPPTANTVVVRPNEYEPGRGHIVIYNWEDLANVSVDVSSILNTGDHYELRDALNYFGTPVLIGTYTGAALSVPMNLTTVAQPIGNATITFDHTAPRFGSFVLIRTQAAGDTIDLKFNFGSARGPKTPERGTKFSVYMTGRDRKSFRVTNWDAVTRRLTVPGHDFVVGNSMIFWVNGAGTRPSVVNSPRVWFVSAVIGDDITIGNDQYPADSTVVVPGSDLGTAIAQPQSTLYVGRGLSSASARVTQPSVPSGITLTKADLFNNGNTVVTTATLDGNGKYIWSGGGGSQILIFEFTIDPSVTTGPKSITWTVEPPRGEPHVEVTWNFTVVEQDNLPTTKPTMVALPQPLFDNVVSKFTDTWLPNECNQTTGELTADAMVIDQFQNIGFYDGARSFYELFMYTGNEIWRKCSLNAANFFNRTVTYAAAPTGEIAMPSTWTSGQLYRGAIPVDQSGAYSATGKKTNYGNTAAALIGKYGTQSNPRVFDDSGRNDYLAIGKYIIAMCAKGYCNSGAIPNKEPYITYVARLKTSVQYAIDHLDTYRNSGTTIATETHVYHQEFICGIALYHLWLYYKWDGQRDHRIVRAIKKHMDWVNSYLWNPPPDGNFASGRFQWHSGRMAPDTASPRMGPRCNHSCFGAWNDTPNPGRNATQLGAMFFPYNALLWKLGYGDAYRVMYDIQLQAWWDNRPADSISDWSPKMMNEFLVGMIKGWRWRQLLDDFSPGV